MFKKIKPRLMPMTRLKVKFLFIMSSEDQMPVQAHMLASLD
jgi:hypothetical protein